MTMMTMMGRHLHWVVVVQDEERCWTDHFYGNSPSKVPALSSLRPPSSRLGKDVSIEVHRTQCPSMPPVGVVQGVKVSWFRVLL